MILGLFGYAMVLTTSVAAIDPPARDTTDLSAAEIVVLGKLNVAAIRFKLKNNGVLQCRVKKPTKEPDIDALACAAVQNCYAAKRQMDAEMMTCIPAERLRLVRAYVVRTGR
jgi:hypothetical protein